jgi:hypothetical protein
MENNHRPRTPAARHVQRSFDGARANHAHPVQPAVQAVAQPFATSDTHQSAEPQSKDFHLELRWKLPARIWKFVRRNVIRPVKRAVYRTITMYLNGTRRRRAMMLVVLGVIVFTLVFPMFESLLDHKTYALSPGENAVLLQTNQSMANLLKYDTQTQSFMFNQNYTPNLQAGEYKAGGSQIKAQISEDASKGVTVTDPINKVDFKVTPEFKLGTGKQQQNRVVFPAFNGGGHLVYTAGAIGVKQDVTLDHYIGDNLEYTYKLELDDIYAAHLEQNGSIGIYGSSLGLSSATAGSDKDRALLQKAQEKAVKDKLLFALPAPVIKEANGIKSNAKAHYKLDGDKLTVVVEKLKDAHYPLSIDPTVTAALSRGQFGFDANIETNVYIDDTNGLIKRSPLTGGNLNAWSTSNGTSITGTLNAAHFMGSAVVYGGTMYVIGGTSTTTTANLTGTNYVEQAKINSDGTVQNFTAGNSTGLPAGGVSRFQLMVYNGYMYIVDGSTTDSTGSSIIDDVYYTRITSESYSAYTNGAQLKNWSHTGATTGPGAGTPRYAYGATVYNGYLYVAGGKTSGGGVATVYYSQLKPSGAPGTWTAGTSLPAARYDFDMQAYNGHIYVVGGNASGLTPSVLYNTIDSTDGSISSWVTTNSLVNSTGGTTSSAAENFGASYTMIYNGYLYVTGGCNALSGSGQCNASGNVLGHSQIAQINADGSLGTFFPNNNASTLQRTGTAVLGYNGTLYSIGGCSVTSTTAYSCTTTQTTTSYAKVNPTIGDISANRTPNALPVQLYGQGTVVVNGYLYVVGGCLTLTCTGTRSMNFSTYYATINSDGSLSSWTNGTTATTTGSPLHSDGQGSPVFSATFDCSAGGTDNCGLAGMSVVTYNGYIYSLGGNEGSSTTSQIRDAYYMQPNASTGAQGLWTRVTNALPAVVHEASAVAYNGSIYMIGGCSGAAGVGCSNTSYLTTVIKSTLNTNGSLNSGFATTNQLQLATNLGIGAFGITLYGNYIYLSGGAGNYTAVQGGTGSTGNDGQSNDVWRAKINASGNIVNVSTGLATGGWTLTTGHLNNARRRLVSYAINGYLYIIGGHSADDPAGPPGGTDGTTYGDVQVGQIDMSTGGTGDITSFTTSSSGTVTRRWNPAIAFSNGFLFVTGGCLAGPPPAGCTNMTPDGTTTWDDEAFVVYNANNLGSNTWNSQTNFYSTASGSNPNIANRLGAGMVAYNGYLYMAGGCTTYTLGTNVCSLATTDVVYAKINADGSMGTWTTSTALANLYAFNQLVAVNGTLYLLTGENSTGVAKSVVRYSVIGANGVPGAWVDATFSLPITLTKAAVTVYANRIYVAGGFDNSSGLNQSNVYYTPALPSGGDITSAWSTATTGFTTARRELSLVSAGAYLYAIGGYDGTNYYSDVQVATPSTSTGNISAWTFVKEIPYKQASMASFGANGYLYVVGGRNGNASTSCNKAVYFAPINQNGTVGDWSQSPSSLSTARFGGGSAYYNGYMYYAGGHDCTSITSTSVVQQSGQLSEAIHATYTRYVDFGTDATLRNLYILGQNAQISGVDIDLWKIIVKTSTSVNNSWGQKYTQSLSSLTTGPNYSTPITFQALDASGVDQGASEYWDVTFDIDQRQSFNFPDTAQPSITLYDFYFSAGPAKRLRLGKTFVNEQQTNLDAHP